MSFYPLSTMWNYLCEGCCQVGLPAIITYTAVYPWERELVVSASALHQEGRTFDSRADTFLDLLFCQGICCAGFNLCCLSLIVSLIITRGDRGQL